MLFRVLLAFFLCALNSSFAAEKPTLEHLFPAGGVRGGTNQITFFGKIEPWPPKAWSSNPGVDFRFGTNQGSAQVMVASNAPVGPCLVRLYNEVGASDLRIFVVSDRREIQESEPNNHFAHAEMITNLPVVVNGRLEKNGDVDSFAFKVKSGQWIDASLDSYTLMAKLDPVLRLVTTNGYQLAWNHDFASLDPRLVWQAPYDLTVVLQAFGFVYPADSDIRLSGGSAGVYRLNLSVVGDAPADFDEKPTEREPNNLTNNACPLTVPSTIMGTICPPGDLDVFALALKKDQEIDARVQAASLGSPLDAWLAIEDAGGTELARNDDSDNSKDPRLEWKAPQDGTYFAKIGSMTHQGTPAYKYHLTIRPATPEYHLTCNADALVLSAGATNSLKLTLKRLHSFTNELTAMVKGLPESVVPDIPAVPGKDGDLNISLVARTNAPPFNGPIQVVVADKQTKEEKTAVFELVSRSENNGVPGCYSKLQVESTDWLWLTVKPETAPQK